MEAEIEEHKAQERKIKAIEREKQHIIDLKQSLKEKRKKKSKLGQTLKKLRSFEGQLERAVHPERFKKDGKRKKGRAGRR